MARNDPRADGPAQSGAEIEHSDELLDLSCRSVEPVLRPVKSELLDRTNSDPPVAIRLAPRSGDVPFSWLSLPQARTDCQSNEKQNAPHRDGRRNGWKWKRGGKVGVKILT
jgi:hypothetical protein